MPVLDVLIIKCFLNFDFRRTRVIDGILVYKVGLKISCNGSIDDLLNDTPSSSLSPLMVGVSF